MTVGGRVVSTLGSGGIVGEISVLTGEPPLASVRTLGTARICRWTPAVLRTLEKRHPDLFLKWNIGLLREMREKLRAQNALAWSNRRELAETRGRPTPTDGPPLHPCEVPR